MKNAIFILLVILTSFVHGQDKYNTGHYNKLTEIEGTNYVIATFEDRTLKAEYNNYLLFINTSNGQRNSIDFPHNVYFEKIEQIKIDSLGINKIIIAAKTDYQDRRKFIDLRERPLKIIVLSVDGQVKTQLTEDIFFVDTWTINKQTGSIVITGHYDINNNGKYDKTDKNEILIFDLKTLKLKSNI